VQDRCRGSGLRVVFVAGGCLLRALSRSRVLAHRLLRRRLRAPRLRQRRHRGAHRFTARPRVTYVDTVGLVKNQDGVGALPYLDRLVLHSFVDNDGIPAKWGPAVVDGEHTAPDGATVPAEDLPKYTAFETGSSCGAAGYSSWSTTRSRSRSS
jgi:hypothetical protein